MASSEDPERPSNPSSRKPENPFIAFRQFADSQVSSFLQGVLGITSTSLAQNNARTRREIFAEEMRISRYKDEQETNQQPSNSYENYPEQQEKKHGNDWLSRYWQAAYKPLGHGSNNLPLHYGIKDLPLYSPLDLSLFNERKYEDASFTASDSAMFGIWHLDLRQYCHEIMPMIRSMVRNDLQGSKQFWSQNSLLPYLLYSPYSPIQLHIKQHEGERDYNNYVSAFEDLLATTYEKPMVAAEIPNVSEELLSLGLLHPMVDCWIGGIDMYARSGLLEEPTSGQEFTHHRKRSVKRRIADHTPAPEQQSTAAQGQDVSSELDMYEAFLRMAQHPASISNTFDSLFKEVEKIIEKEVGPKEADMLREQRGAFIKKHGDDIEGLKGILNSFMVPFQQAFKEEGTQAMSQVQTEKSDRVVSTTTTTEHHTDEHGTTETSVTVCKVFADGRSSTTSTYHIEDPPSQNHSEHIDREESNEDKKTTRKGWFWI